MKKSSIVKTVIATGLMSLAACSSDDESTNPSKGEKIAWTFEVGADDGNRTQLDANNKVVFKKGDEISVFNDADASENAKFTATKIAGTAPDDTASVAKFNGEANIGARNFWILYPYQSDASCNTSGVITATIPTTQTATPDTFDPKANISVATTEAHAWDVPKFYLKNIVGLLKFTVNQTYDKIVIYSANTDQKIAGEVKITVTGGDPTIADGTAAKMSDSIVVTGEINPGSNYYVAMRPNTYNDGITMKFYKGSNVGRVRIWTSKQTFKITRSKILNVGTPRPNTLPTTTDGSKFIDLGLIGDNGKPLYFRDRNLGADIPEDCGLYYAWGMVKPLFTKKMPGASLTDAANWVVANPETDIKYPRFNASSGYIWNNAPYQTRKDIKNTDHVLTKFTKYTNNDPAYTETGYSDTDDAKKTVLDLADDAAYNYEGVNYEWRMPATEEFQKLCGYTNSNWGITHGGQNVKGRTFTSKVGGYTDIQIFFPCAGYMYQKGVEYPTNLGSAYYWSSSLVASRPYQAYILYFVSNSVNGQDYNYRYNGFTIRPCIRINTSSRS